MFNRYVERGGEEIAVEKIHAELCRNHEVRMLEFDSSSWQKESKLKRLSQPLRMIANPKSLGLIEQEIADFKPDLAVLHNMFPIGSLFAYRALQSHGVPVVQFIHNFRPFSVNGYCWANGQIEAQGLRRNFFPEIFHGSWQNSLIKTAIYGGTLLLGHWLGIWRRIDCWIAISDFMRNQFIGAGIDPERIVTLAHSMDPARGAENLAAPEESKTLLFMGRLTPEKGLLPLLQAWKKVEAERNDGRLLICGSGPLEDSVKCQVASCKRAEFLGVVSGEKKEQVISEAAAVAVPSLWWEPFGLVTLEAYSAGKPVLAAASGALTETVRSGETGWLHVPGDHEELSRQIHELFDIPELAQQRGQAGRRWLEECFSSTQWRADLNQILTSVAGAKHSI